jgi:hypothetical protein
MNVGAEARAMTYLSEIVNGRRMVPASEYDALAARYDQAVELLGRWLDGECPDPDTRVFLSTTDRGSET